MIYRNDTNSAGTWLMPIQRKNWYVFAIEQLRLLSLCDKYFSIYEIFFFFHMLIRHTVLRYTPFKCVEIRRHFIKIWLCNVIFWGTWWCRWLGHCTTSRKVMGSIPSDNVGILHWHNTSGCTLALGSTQSLAEMSTRNISWGVKLASA
jgi:hypothetical protein